MRGILAGAERGGLVRFQRPAFRIAVFKALICYRHRLDRVKFHDGDLIRRIFDAPAAGFNLRFDIRYGNIRQLIVSNRIGKIFPHISKRAAPGDSVGRIIHEIFSVFAV